MFKQGLSFLSASIPQRIHEKTLKQIKQISLHIFWSPLLSFSFRVLPCSGCLWSPVSRAEALGDALAFNTTLVDLSLGSNEIGPMGAKALRGGPAHRRETPKREWEGDGWRERCWGNSSFWKKTERCGSIQQLNFLKKNATLFLIRRCFCLEI